MNRTAKKEINTKAYLTESYHASNSKLTAARYSVFDLRIRFIGEEKEMANDEFNDGEVIEVIEEETAETASAEEVEDDDSEDFNETDEDSDETSDDQAE